MISPIIDEDWSKSGGGDELGDNPDVVCGGGLNGTSILRLDVNVSLKQRFGTRLTSSMAALKRMFVCLWKTSSFLTQMCR